MKRIIASFFLICLITPVYAQQSVQPIPPNQAVRFDESAPLMTMTSRTAWGPEREREDKNDDSRSNSVILDKPTPQYPNAQMDASALAPGPAPFISFDGPSEDDNEFPLQPPDPNGVIGLDHYIGMYNLVTEIFDRDGVSLTGPFPSNAFFNGFGGVCENTNDGDPIVLYDRIHDRWIVSQFAIVSTNGPSAQCVAISTSGDPLGSYFRYEFEHSPFGDYPKLGLAPSGDEIFVMYRMFGSSPSFLVGGIMDYASMRVGNPGVELLINLDQLIQSAEPGVFADGFLPVNYIGDTSSGQPPFFAGHLNTSSGASFDQFMIIDITDFDFQSGEISFDLTQLPVDPYDVSFCGTFGGCIDQPSGQDLAALSFFTMHSLSSLDFGSHFGSVVTHTVDVGVNRAALRWYEVRNENGNWTLYQQGTYSPDSNDRWMGSAVQDINGNIFIGYSVSGPDLFPSIAYVGQTAGAPLGQLNIDETIIHPGEGSHDGGRWGDYSMASVDPVNPNSFWYTHEYVGNDGDWRTRILGVTLEVDEIPPGPIADLEIVSVASTTMELSWTDVGDDIEGDGVNDPVRGYDIRFSIEPINESNFEEAEEALYTGMPGEPGVDVQVQTIRPLLPSQLYYVAVRAVDESGNLGPISNVASASTLAAPEFAADPTEIDLGVVQNNQEITASTTISNAATEESVLEFSFPRFAAMEVLNDPSRPKNPTSTGLNVTIPKTKGASAAYSGIGNEVILGAGGPDNFGYMWIDSDEPGGPLANNFFDISGIGVQVQLNQDCAFESIDCNSEPISLPFSFPFYGEDQSEIVINDNGFIRFESGFIAESWVNQLFPDPFVPNGLIAPFWDDLGTDQSEDALLHYYFDELADVFVVQWTNVPYYDSIESNTFQVVLFRNGRFLFQYGFVEPRATESIGIENQDGTDGLQVAFFTDYIESGKAVLFIPPVTPIAPFITDVEPAFGTLNTNESLEVTITGNSANRSSGSYDEELLVVHNGLEGETLLVTTLGVEGFVALRTEPEELVFGGVVEGLTKTLTLTIINDGTDSLVVDDLLFNNPDYTSDEQTIVLGPNGERASLSVTYAPQAVENDGSVLEIVSNDSNSPFVVPLIGQGVEPPEIAVDPEVLELVEIEEFTEILETQVLTVLNNSPTALQVSSRVLFDDAEVPEGMDITETPFFKRERSERAPLGDRLSREYTPVDPRPAAPVTQGFEEGIMPPTDWGLFQTNPEQTWLTVDFFPFSGSYSAFIQYDPALVPQDEWIIGPEGFYSGTLRFYSAGSLQFCRDVFDNCDLEVWLLQGAPGGGDDFFLDIADDDWEGDFVYSETIIQLDSLDIPRGTRTSVAFRYVGVDGDAVLIDDINVDFEPNIAPVRIDLEDFVVNGNGSQEIRVDYSAENESGRVITGAVELLSNDPVNPIVNVPFTFSVLGIPDIEVSQLFLDLGAVEVGNERSQSFYISNAGSENPSLLISGLTVSGSGADNFSVLPLPAEDDPLIIGSADSVEVIVTYAPSAIAFDVGTLVVTSNDGDEPELVIDLSGEGLPTPSVTLSDSLFSASLFTGGTDTQTLTISNIGQENSVLNYSLSVLTGTPDPESRPVRREDADKRPAPVRESATKESVVKPLYLLTADSTSEIVLFEEDFESGIPAEWVVVDREGTGLVFSDITTCGEFANYTGGSGDAACASSDVFGPSAYDTELVTPDITFGLERDLFLSFYVNFQAIADQLDIDLSVDGGRTWTTMRSYSDSLGAFRSVPGEKVTIPLDPYIYGESAGEVSNLIRGLRTASLSQTFKVRWRYYDPNAGDDFNWYVQLDNVEVVSSPEWVIVEPASGNIEAGEQDEVLLNFLADGIGDNSFEANIGIQTNDPSAPLSAVRVTLDVTGAQDLLLVPDALDFDSVTVGLDRTLAVVVQNAGVLPLTISDIANSLPTDYTIELVSDDPDIDPFAPLEPGDTRTLVVLFAPVETGERQAELTIQSDDPDESEFVLVMDGFGLPTPDIQVTPSTFQFEAYVSEITSEVLTITNVGASGSELNFLIDASELEESLNDSTMNALADETFLTHSLSQEIVQFNSVACQNGSGHTDNSYFRAFNLVDFGIETDFTLSEVQFGVESAAALGDSQLVVVNAYLSDEPFPTGTITLIDSATLVIEDQELTILSTPLSAVVPAGSEIVLEVFTPLGEGGNIFFIGSNPFGQTGPTYLAAADCGLPDPLDIAEIGFPDMQIVMNLVGQVQSAPQLVVSPQMGIVKDGESVEVIVSLDASSSNLPGDYLGNLNILTNVPADLSITSEPTRPQSLLTEVGLPNTKVVEVPVELDLIPFTVSIADREVNPSQDFIIDLDIDSIEELNLSTYQLVLKYDPEKVRLLQAVTAGTISEGLTIQTNTSEPGRVFVAAASDFGAEEAPLPLTLEGEGTLIRFAFRAEQQFGDAGINLEEFFFDEGALTTFPNIGRIDIVPLFGDANVDARLSLFDAHYTLQAVVDLVEITEVGAIQAEVSGNQVLTAFDANLIAQRVIGTIDCFPAEEGCEASTKSESSALLAWGGVEQVNGDIQLPLLLENTTGSVYALQLDVDIDPNQVTIDGIEASLPDTWRMEHRVSEAGRLKIAMMGTTPLLTGELGRLNLTFADSGDRFNMEAVVLVNENAPLELQSIEVGDIPTEFVLHQNYPNPFNPTTTIAYQLAEDADVRLEIYNVLGQRVHMLVNAAQKAGSYKVVWDTTLNNGEAVSSGTYFYRLTAGAYEETKVMLLIK